MSGNVDVGDGVPLTFTTTPGATVTLTWLNPDGATVLDNIPVAESPTGSGQYPYMFLPASPGVWTAQFTASGTATQVERYYIRASALTGPPPLATLGDVTAQFGALTAAQSSLAAWLLRAGSSMVRARFPLIDVQIANGVLNPDIVALVVTNMVLRVLRNPNGLKAETIGPFSRTYDTTVAAGLLAFSPAELAMLIPVVTGVVRAGVGTIPVGAGLSPHAKRPFGLRRFDRPPDYIGW